MPSNIAEGSARGTNKEYLHYLYIARASLTETQYFVHLSTRLEYLKRDDAKVLEETIKSVFVRLHGLTKAVEQETSRFGKTRALLSSGLALIVSRMFYGS